MMYSKFVSVGAYYPSLVSDDEYIEVFGRKAKQAQRFLGHHTRYQTINLQTGKCSINNIEMAYHAATKAIQNAGIESNDIDLILYSTLTPEFLAPASYVYLQERLGIKVCKGFDIRSGCAGFGTALATAAALIESEFAKRALIIGADLVSSRFAMFLNNPSEIPIRALVNMMMFGDAAGALILEATECKGDSIFYKNVLSNRPNIDAGSYIIVGGSLEPYGSDNIPKEKWPICQTSGLSEQHLPAILMETLREFSLSTGMGLEQIQHYILPVLDARMLPMIEKELPEFPVDRSISIEPTGGALVNAAVPLSLDLGVQCGTVKKGDSLVLFAGENTKWQHAIIAGKW